MARGYTAGNAPSKPTAGERATGAGLNLCNRANDFANLSYWVRTRRTEQGWPRRNSEPDDSWLPSFDGG
jgi:hypothetical protein